MSLANYTPQKERPAFVRFVVETMEDIPATKREGRWIAKDVEFAHITSPGTKEIFKQKVTDWFANMKQNVASGLFRADWEADYKEQYRLWKLGQEMPLNGVPIKGWGVIAPAMQETLLRMHVRTVEDLAALNDEGLRRIGMGAVDLKNKAVAWLAQMQDKGPLTVQMAGLQKDNENLQVQLKTLLEQLDRLKQLMPSPESVAFVETAEEISADDIIEDEPKGKKGKR